MVYLSNQTRVDLNDIRQGLLTWNKFELSEAFIIEYINNIVDVCYLLNNILYHFNTEYEYHKQFGSNVYKFRVNPKTTWYIIYDIDIHDNILVNKITSNHITY
jgi:uncharacterized membrane protein